MVNLRSRFTFYSGESLPNRPIQRHYWKLVVRRVLDSSTCAFYRAHSKEPILLYAVACAHNKEKAHYNSTLCRVLFFDTRQTHGFNVFFLLLAHDKVKKNYIPTPNFSTLDIQHMVFYFKIWYIFVFVCYI
jgi:hypothetical protein